ncbi:MAG: MerR family transcriptional regulator [Clostridia bacterium]|nr:MerR family transcriptional regulator [Clostridia bacterium]
MEKEKAIPKGYRTVGEVAKKMGVTVRALQYYDREGVFRPSRVSEGGRRLYSDEDIVKLHQILTLKSLGFSFDEIKNRLISVDTPQKAKAALTEQSKAIQAQIDRLTESLQAIELLKREIDQMQVVDFSKYADIIINLQMGNENYGLIKHFDDSLLDYCHKKFDQETGGDFIRRFHAISDQVERCIEGGFAPDSEQGQRLARDFWQLITEFTDGDRSRLLQLMRLGDEDTPMQNVIRQFIEPALEVYFRNSEIDPFEENHG